MSIADAVKELEAKVLRLERDRYDEVEAHNKAARERNDARALLAKVTAERDACHAESAGKDGAVKVLQNNLDAMFEQRRTSKAIDPTRWRGPHGAPRDDDTHRWREATVDGVDVLIQAWQSVSGVWWWGLAPGELRGAFATITDACEAADAHVAGLAQRTFTVERDRDGTSWRLASGEWDGPYAVANLILKSVRGHASSDREDLDFAGEHWARLFAGGGTITESEVKAWLAARGEK